LAEIQPELVDPGNASVLMGYDFHVDSEGRLRLIEINTNASVSLVADLLYRVQALPNIFASDARREILESFREEWLSAHLSHRSTGTPKRIAIVDENPSQQKMFGEFLL